jgi:Mn2+/Fe2+ NRAMP family transporter
MDPIITTSDELVVTPPGIAAPRGITVRSKWLYHILSYLMVFGPGLIVMVADNDAGAVSTYTQAGAQYGTHLLWLMLLLLPVTYFTQEMVTRLGIATGQGYATMIFKRFGSWWGRFSVANLLLVNFLTLATEFAAISLALSSLGASPYIAVPLAAIGLILMVVTGNYLRWERITIGLCLFDALWFILVFMVHPSGFDALHNTVLPQVPPGGITTNLIFLTIAIVGTTIAPWQLFFQQSCVADKRLRVSDLKMERLDTFIGACFTVAVAGSMMLVGNVLYTHHISFSDPAQMARALGPMFGPLFRYGIPLLMMNAAVLGATAVSLASSWAWSEMQDKPHSLQKRFQDAPDFYLTYVGTILLAAGLVLIPNAPLQLIIIGVQVLAGIMLPSAITFLQLLLNDRELLGPELVNKPWNNVINWTVIAVLFILSLVLAAQVLVPNLFPAS